MTYKQYLNDEDFTQWLEDAKVGGDYDHEEIAIMVYGSLKKAIKAYKEFLAENA